MTHLSAGPTATLRAVFQQHHGAPPPSCFVRAPGRVNLIGEHTDYNDLPVFPMAIRRAVTILARPRDDDTVRVVNADPGFEPVSFAIGRDIAPHPTGHWANYVKAAAQALAEPYSGLRGFDGVVRGDIPVAAGLSSSSAVVVASALALTSVNEIEILHTQLATRLAQGERYVGTAGGGMDQAISLGARRGTASVIEFQPLRLTAVPVPPEWRFVVASSLVRAEKSGPAQETYNRRTRECREAARLMAGALGLPPPASYPRLLAHVPLEELVAAGNRNLEQPLRDRFRHVVTEAGRVSDARTAMAAADATAFGSLMSASHRSLRDDYAVSRPELDELVELATGAGAHGARLTGAGFGGSIVALCGPAELPPVLAVLTKRFFQPRGIQEPMERELFVAEPSDGAVSLELTADS